MKKLPSEKTHNIIKLSVSFSVMLIISVICFIIPLRPTVSLTEQRELASFPEFSFSSLLSGEYFSDISLWFSDTVPFRDDIMKLNSKIQNFLGTSGALSGFAEGVQGDAIPTVPNKENITTTPDTTEIITEATTVEATTAEITTAPTETTQAVTEAVTESTDSSQDFEQLGNLLINGNAAYEYYYFVQDRADAYISALNTAASKFSSKAKIYSTVIPIGMDITLSDNVRSKLTVSDQKQAIAYMLGSMSPAISTFNCFDTLKNHRNEYLYFRTDHHWTGLAAFYAYEIFCQTKGITPLKLNDFELMSFDGFLGSFYKDTGSSPALGATPDRVDAYKPPCEYSMLVTDKNGNTTPMQLIYNATNSTAHNKYGAFISGDNPLSVITNESLTNGESCLVIKESYGNAFVPYLVYHYKTVYVIDYRHYTGSLSSFLIENDVDDIIFINNISMTRNQKLITSLTNFISN